MATQKTPEYYVTMTVAKLFDDEKMRMEFMNVYGQSTSAAQAFLQENLDIPEDMAKQIVALKGEEMNNFVGKNVCTYLW